MSVWPALAGFSRLFPGPRLTVIGDRAGWVLDYEASQIAGTLRRAGHRAVLAKSPWPGQPAFFMSREMALGRIDRWRRMGVPVCFPYYHGYPGRGEDSFDATYELLRRHHHDVARIQVTNDGIRTLLLEAGVGPEKIRTILIGIDAGAFSAPTAAERDAARRRFRVPESAVVVGSFQKDGSGWDEGLVAKPIKGPDVLVDALSRLKKLVPELFVLLSGPARGFVKRGLESAGVAYAHTQVSTPAGVASLYHALDVYLVASREEGGPKAVLESMASGVPIVSTRVGQAPALIRHGETGWLANPEDAEALAQLTLTALQGSRPWLSEYRRAARLTAEAHDYSKQTGQWEDFFSGLLPSRS